MLKQYTMFSDVFEKRRFVGVISLRDLLLSEPNRNV